MIELKITFADFNDLTAWLNKHGDTPVGDLTVNDGVNVSSVTTANKPAPKKRAAKKPAKPKVVAEVVEPAVEVNHGELRANLQKELIAKNDAFNDGSAKIMAFVKSFGVNKFSELGDDTLVDFGQKLEALV